jgi:DNA-binding transcriptional regulator YdaS (Cro superfamily)
MQKRNTMDVHVQLAAVGSIFGDAPSSHGASSALPISSGDNRFVAETAKELAEVEQQSLSILLKRLDRYDPSDTTGFPYLVRQVLDRVAEEQALAAAIGVHPATLSRWAGRGGKSAVPPIFVRAAAIAAFSKVLEVGLSEMQTRYSELNAYMAKVAREKMAAVAKKRGGDT